MGPSLVLSLLPVQNYTCNKLIFSYAVKKNIFEVSLSGSKCRTRNTGPAATGWPPTCGLPPTERWKQGLENINPFAPQGKPPPESPKHALLTGIRLFRVTNFVMAMVRPK